MGPGLFSDIGKKTTDLLYQHYNIDQKFTLTSHTSQNVTGELVYGVILSQIKNKISTIDIRVDSDSNLVTTVTQNDLLKPGLRGIFSLVVPDQRSGKTNQGDSLNAAYYHLVNPDTAVGAEVVHRLSNNTTRMAFGAQHVVESRSMVKARVNSYGIASALLQHAWHPSSLISVSLETDILANDGNCRVGLALALRP